MGPTRKYQNSMSYGNFSMRYKNISMSFAQTRPFRSPSVYRGFGALACLQSVMIKYLHASYTGLLSRPYLL